MVARILDAIDASAILKWVIGITCTLAAYTFTRMSETVDANRTRIEVLQSEGVATRARADVLEKRFDRFEGKLDEVLFALKSGKLRQAP